MEFTIPVVFMCKTCRVVFNKIKDFILHKQTIHLIEIQKLKCIVFEECSSAHQGSLLPHSQPPKPKPKTHEPNPDASDNTTRTTINTDSNSSLTWEVPVFIPIPTIIKEETEDTADAEPDLEEPLQAKQNHLLPSPSTNINVCPSYNKELPSTNEKSANNCRKSQQQQPYVRLRRLKLKEIQPDSSFTKAKTRTKKVLQNRSSPGKGLLKLNRQIFKDADKVGHKLKTKSSPPALSHADNSKENQNLCSTNTEDKLFKKSLTLTWHLTAFRKSRMYKCPSMSCKKLFHSFHTLKLHMMQQHSCKFKQAHQSLFTCDICKNMFRSSVYLNRHVERDHTAKRMREIQNQNKNQSGQCPPTMKEKTLGHFLYCSKGDCSFSFGSKEELATHERLHNATQYKKCAKNEIIPPVLPTW